MADSIDIGTFDIDNLVGDIINDNDNLDDLDIIPSKDSDSDGGIPPKEEDINAILDMEDLNSAEFRSNAKRAGAGNTQYPKTTYLKNEISDKKPMGRDTMNALAVDVIDDIDVDSPGSNGPRSSDIGDMDMEQFTLRDIGDFGEEEKKPSRNNNNYDDEDEDKEVAPVDLSEHQDLLDEAVMQLLHPDYFMEEQKHERRNQLVRHTPKIKELRMGVKQIENEIVDVAEAMSKIEKVAMYDQDWYTKASNKKGRDRGGKMGDEKQKERYLMKEEELSTLNIVPASFFGKDKEVMLLDDGDDLGRDHGPSSAGLDYLRNNTQSLGGDITDKMGGFVKGLGQQKQGSRVVCGACGVPLKFKAKKRHKAPYKFYIGFKCSTTRREWLFHDHLCVKLRKIKEAIKYYVFEQEKEEHNINTDDPNAVINALINIETNSSQKASGLSKPKKRTTPRKGDHNYNMDGDGDGAEKEDSHSSRMRESIEYSMTNISGDDQEYTDEEDRDRYGGQMDDDQDKKKKKKKKGKKEQSIRQKNFDKLGFIINDEVKIPKYLHFRRYRTHVKRIIDRTNTEGRIYGKSIKTYGERFSDLPEILLYCDLNEFGTALFQFVSESLKSKMRKALWHILEWLALEMPTNEILSLLKKHTHLLSKHELTSYDAVCKATMEGSKFPIACALRLSAFMYKRALIDLSNQKEFTKKGKQYVEVARKLLKEIESDHLFAMLLMIPTDIGHSNVIEIALNYDLKDFLEDPRIVRVFNCIWFHGYDFLDPDSSFAEPEIKVDTVFDKIRQTPGRFFFSAFGKFIISSILYIGYLALFSYVTYLRIYDYKDITDNYIEIVLWICSAGYVVYEVLEFVDSPKEYFDSFINAWDILISINWLVLFYLRFIRPQELEYGVDGTLDEAAQRNTLATEIYMGVWATQCVILWTRVVSIFKISEGSGPLIRMIMNMLSDIANFFIIWILFFIGGSFAAYYIIGGDLQEEEDVELGTLSSVSFYIFKTLIGQQDWDKTKSVVNTQDPTQNFEVFDETRSNMLQSLLFFYSIFGTILLLNLLIAMMASSYDRVQNISLQELNKQKIDTIYELDRSRAIITPPFNVAAYFFYAYWYAFEIIAWALTFGHRQFNEEYFSPINHGLTQYSVGDVITFRKMDRQLKGQCVARTPKADRNTKTKNLGRASMIGGSGSGDFDADLQVEHSGIKYDLSDAQITNVKKQLFKRRRLRIPSLLVENEYCRYCRYNLSNDNMTIDYYLSLFERRGQHIDPDDKRYMRELLASQDHSGIPQPITCNLCPNCYRPFKVMAKGPDVINRMMYILEIVSYLVFWMTLRWVLLLALFLPAFIVKVIKWAIKKFAQTLSRGSSERATKSIMNTSEENDDYRAKVRQVSKQEENMDAVVKRIDISVDRLEKTLIGNENDEDDGLLEEIHHLRSDEFDEEIKKMKKELNEKFDKIQKLLNSSGFDD